MTVQYTVPVSGMVTIASSELDTLADGAAQVGIEQSATTQLYANFELIIGVQGGARTNGLVSLILVPKGPSDNYGEITDEKLASNYIAQYSDGSPVTFELDDVADARRLVANRVKLPSNAAYKAGHLNKTSQPYATGNQVLKSNDYSADNA